jgi:hypothetical protein
MEAADVMNKFFIDKVDDLRRKALFPNTGILEVPYVRQDAAHVAQEVDDVLQEADNDTMSSSHVPPLPVQVCEREEDVGGHKRPQQHRGLGDGQHTHFSAEERG